MTLYETEDGKQAVRALAMMTMIENAMDGVHTIHYRVDNNKSMIIIRDIIFTEDILLQHRRDQISHLIALVLVTNTKMYT